MMTTNTTSLTVTRLSALLLAIGLSCAAVVQAGAIPFDRDACMAYLATRPGVSSTFIGSNTVHG